MSLREWRPRRIVALCVGWILIMIALTVARAMLWSRQVQSGSDDLYVIMRPPGGAWAVAGPPLLLLAIWSWNRRSVPPK